ncbi:hypothetical protein CEXT_714281 [Caerostris extrusa]|uniref:Uncharacterized protein n=1 Tax=Caerostris extrusa TaxID=172846 RepID=A0AAV4N369_CAEEX|nr:hypothetical protein CEXT_714281 [Caerostris extrusa]
MHISSYTFVYGIEGPQPHFYAYLTAIHWNKRMLRDNLSKKQIPQPPLSPDDDAKDDDEVGCVLWIIVSIVFHLTLFVVIISYV